MIKYLKDSNVNVLDIKELKELWDIQRRSKRINDTTYTKTEHYKKTVDFFNWYLSYVDDILKHRTYNDKQIAEIIFKAELKSPAETKEFLSKSLFISRAYVMHLNDRINEGNVGRFDHSLTELLIDLEELISQYEVHVKKSVSNIHLESWRRKNLSPADIYGAARQMFHIEELDDLNKLYLRDLKPVVMFQIRQTLEVYAKELIGFVDVSDPDGNPIKKFTQAGWDFIKEELKRPSSRISFPFDVQMILNINNWANSFVHTTYIFSSYIQYFSLSVLRVLFTPGSKPIKQFNGKSERKILWADITIRDYNSLKADFELYVSSRISNARVQWEDIKRVGAYITSL